MKKILIIFVTIIILVTIIDEYPQKENNNEIKRIIKSIDTNE